MRARDPFTDAASTSWASSDASRKIMRANRGRDSGPERAVRSLLHGRGMRFRVDHHLRIPGVRSRPDIAFTRHRVAVFVDGCFWHCCPLHGTMPKANRSYWEPKLAANEARDRRVTYALEAAGWTVLRFWEHENPATVADRIADALRRAEFPRN